jgi:transcriptional regulator with XRE-family HTH domain
MSPQQARQLAALLRRSREQLGLSAHEVARRAGVNVGTVTRIELAQIPSPRPENLAAIGQVLGIPAADLFAVARWVPSGELPTLKPYLRAKYHDMSEGEMADVEAYVTKLAKKHHGHGPIDGEDEH